MFLILVNLELKKSVILRAIKKAILIKKKRDMRIDQRLSKKGIIVDIRLEVDDSMYRIVNGGDVNLCKMVLKNAVLSNVGEDSDIEHGREHDGEPIDVGDVIARKSMEDALKAAIISNDMRSIDKILKKLFE